VPANSKIIPNISAPVNISPKNIQANTATNPGVSTKSGRALLNSRRLIPDITSKKDILPNKDFNATYKYVVNVTADKSIKNKKGKEKTALNKASKNENDSAPVSKSTRFSKIAAVADNKAELKAK